MQTANLCPGRTARFLVLSIVVGAVITVTSSIVSPTQSCPVPDPRPLGKLYLSSESIVIARVGKSEIRQVENKDGEDNDYRVTRLKTALLVSSTLKGEHRPVVYVDHYIYEDNKDQLSSSSADDTLLVFLHKTEETGSYIVDMDYGLKKLSDADLKVYVSRIEELASIMKGGTPSDTEIVEWLVRCAEEPATQWEGAYELEISHYLLNREAKSNVNLDAVEVSEGQPSETPFGDESIVELEISTDFIGRKTLSKANYARLLTTEQKYRLTTALLNTETLTERNTSLLDVVQRWDDARLVPYLLAQLDLIARPTKSEQTSPYLTELLMTIVADKLGDDALKAMVKRISGSDDMLAETYEDDQASSEENEAEAVTNPEQEAGEEAAAIQRRTADLQYFVTLAFSTVPKTPTAEPANLLVSAEP